MTKEQIIDCLIKTYHHDPRAWQIFTNLRTGVGNEIDGNRFIDLFAFKLWVYGTRTYKKYDRVAYEIVLSTNELHHARQNSLKRRPAKLASSYYYFVAPKNVITPRILPLDGGLIEITQNAQGGLNQSIAIPSPRFDYAPSWKFAASMLRTQAKEFRARMQENK